MMDETIRKIRSILAPGHMADPVPLEGSSAVLAPLVKVGNDLFFLFERRPDGNARFAGHLCFPGGRIEPEDASPLAAALRESEEEVGFGPDDVEVLGHLLDTPAPTGRAVSCFVGLVSLDRIPERPASPREVDELILVPLRGLLSAGLGDPVVVPEWPPHAYTVNDYELRMFPSAERLVQYWYLRGVEKPSVATLWGFTAGVVAQFLSRVYDWSPPVAPRIVGSWQGLLPSGQAEAERGSVRGRGVGSSL